MINYLISYHGGHLAFNEKLNKICLTDSFEDFVYPLVLDNETLKIKINQNIHVFSLNGLNIKVLRYSEIVKIKADNHFFFCDKERNIYYSESDILPETQFFISSTLNDDFKTLFEKDIYQIMGKEESHFNIPKKIWLYWEQNERPDFIKACDKQLIKLNPNYEIHFLNKNNLSDFLPESFISAIFSTHLTPTLRSDLIRLKLLYEYGGIWLDSSIIFNESIDKILSLNEYNPFELHCFYMRLNGKEYYPNAVFPILENWFMATSSKSEFIALWLNKLFLTIEVGIDNFLNYIRSRHDYIKIKRNYNEVYYLAYIAQQAALLDLNGRVNIKAYCAENSAFYFQMNNYSLKGYTHFSAWNELVMLPKERLVYLPNLIKFTGVDRKNLEKIKELDYCNPNSYLYPLLYNE